MRVDEKRRSLYDADEVELLARRGHPRANRRPRAGIDVTIGSAVSTIEHGRIRYRGHDLIRLLDDEVAFEDVAELLWSGVLPGHASASGTSAGGMSASGMSTSRTSADGASANGMSWSLADDVRAVATGAVAALDDRVGPLRRMAVAVLAAAPLLNGPAGDPEIGRQLVMLLAESAGDPRPAWAGGTGIEPAERLGVEPDADTGPEPFPLARRLWTRLSPLPPTADRVHALNRALVVLADHELATSTLAARIAASARASLPACLLAALGTLDGGLHGGVSDLVHQMLLDLAAPSRRRWISRPCDTSPAH
ncbi:MAG: hypothetical protein IRZ08_08330 [Frankia sp.]|nr:hypothetical protein [Frankia sp.]